MKTYYIHDGRLERGPFALPELQGKITKDTPVWKLGLDNWTKASELQELRPLLSEHIPYPFPSSPGRKKKNYLGKLMEMAGIGK